MFTLIWKHFAHVIPIYFNNCFTKTKWYLRTVGRALVRSLNVSQTSKLLGTAFLPSGSDSVNGNDLHGGLLQRIPATVPRGPDNAIVISVLCVFLCVLATCKDRNHTSVIDQYNIDGFWKEDHLLWRRKSVMVYPGSIFHWDGQHGSGSSTNQTLPARHSVPRTCHCLCQVYWTACHCGMCRICHWDRRQSRSHQRHHQHLHQSSKHTSSGMHQLLVQVWKWRSRHTWEGNFYKTKFVTNTQPIDCCAP